MPITICYDALIIPTLSDKLGIKNNLMGRPGSYRKWHTSTFANLPLKALKFLSFAVPTLLVTAMMETLEKHRTNFELSNANSHQKSVLELVRLGQFITIRNSITRHKVDVTKAQLY